MSLATLGTFVVATPNGRGVTFAARPDTNDGALVVGILGEDEYLLRDHAPLTGWALDIGAHVGTVAIALAADHPDLKVIAVEPVPENADLIRHNVGLNGLDDRVYVEAVAAAKVGESTVPCHFGYTDAGIPDKGYVIQNRYIGNIWRKSASAVGESINAPAVSLADLASKYGTDRFTFCKIDCEGCEWSFLASGAGIIDEIVGEWHDEAPDAIVKLLRRTHNVRIVVDHGGSGIFHAVHK